MDAFTVLIINAPFVPDFCRTQRWAARTRGRVLRPPDWLAYATAVLEQAGFVATLHDFPAMGWGKEDLERLISRQQPRLVVLDSTTPSIYSDIECAAICKRHAPGCVVLMVGPHASERPEETLKEAAGAVDAIAVGEYDLTLLDYAQALRDKRSVGDVLGLVFLEGASEVRRTPPRPLIDTLDELPFPAWHQLDLHRYFDGIKLHPFVDIIGGRGCPFTCSFCLWPQTMHGQRYRMRSVENIIAEMEWVLKIFPAVGKGEFFFEDDTFTADHRRARAFCERLLEKKLDCTWSINSRADVTDLDLLRLMKRAGCRMLVVGFESGSQRMLDAMGKKIRVKRMEQFIHTARQAGLRIHGCFVLGLPGEDRASMEQTLEFALANPLDTVQFSGAVPYPGTLYFDHMERSGLLRAQRWDQWLQDGEQAPVVDYPGLGRAEIEAFVDGALKKFYFRPAYMVRFLLATRSRADLYRKLRGARNFIGYLISRSRKTPRRIETCPATDQDTAEPWPMVSVIVCVYNDREFIVSCLAALQAQDYPAQRMEILVVDDGSDDDSTEVVQGFAGVRLIRQTHQGPSVARNAGILQARGDLLAFTDSDCEPEPDWLRRLVEAMATWKGSRQLAAVGGRQSGHPDDPPFGRRIDAFFQAIGFLGGYLKSYEELRPVDHNASCNVLYRKDLLLAVGGFRPQLFPGEDVDLDHRLTRLDKIILYTPSARVRHHRPGSWRDWLRMLTTYGQAAADTLVIHGPFRGIQLLPPLLVVFLGCWGGLVWGLGYPSSVVVTVTPPTLLVLATLGLRRGCRLPLTTLLALISTSLLWFSLGYFRRLGAFLIDPPFDPQPRLPPLTATPPETSHDP
ncbi:MAG: glycosyltransferase [Magnetococcales bacterium]|nr:glycosyltransferase [Magnetococcales bacterium]